jgi:predicted CxxxxCH...CXXCH cytochrome family protein
MVGWRDVTRYRAWRVTITARLPIAFNVTGWEARVVTRTRAVGAARARPMTLCAGIAMSTERKHLDFSLRELVQLAGCVALLVGCLETHESPIQANTCTACHGDGNRLVGDPSNPTQAAPPFDLNGNSATSAPGVGAHQAHLTESASHLALTCNECHTVPKAVFDPGHLDNKGSARITFGLLAQSLGSSPTYDVKTQSCTGTYCHKSYVPNWTAPKTSADACGTCHGLPPPLPHPQNAQCYECHGDVIDKNRNFVNKSRHIDGNPVRASTLACNSCHGSADSNAPPPDLEGNVDPKFPGVGAHANHLQASSTHSPVACNQCHVVPTVVPTADNLGHAEGTPPANISFGNLATSGNNNPAYDFTVHSCSGTYCHGSYSPEWTAPRDSQQACGSCHGLPPPAPHPQKTDCSLCHSQVIGANQVFVNSALHVNGTVEVTPPCNSCHGSANSNAPPADLSGNTDVTAKGVGAHQRHLLASSTHGPVACNQCHLVPDAWSSLGHDVTAAPPAVITFNTVGLVNNSSAVYSYTDHTCTNTYCHGADTPNWVAQLAPAQTCGTCHALPPPFVPGVPISALSHPKATDCSRCHGTVAGQNLSIIGPGLHVDGLVEVELDCGSCHGSSASPAPPTDLAGNMAVSSIGVGAHQTHLAGGQSSRPVPCNECHIVPVNVNDPGHIDDWGTAEVTFSGAAIAGNHQPSWSHQTANCTDSWCHGPGNPGNISPTWNDPAATITCTNCHGLPPAPPHPQVPQCNLCHTNATNAFTFINRALHVNGNVDF